MSEGSERHWVSVAGAVVDDAGRILAIRRRDNNQWEPPGGILERSEEIVDGLVREIREETGLQVAPIGLSGVYKNMRKAIVALVFTCRVVSGHARPTEEAAEVRFLTPDQVKELMDQAYACRLLDAFDNEVSIRSHDGVKLLSAKETGLDVGELPESPTSDFEVTSQHSPEQESLREA